ARLRTRRGCPRWTDQKTANNGRVKTGHIHVATETDGAIVRCSVATASTSNRWTHSKGGLRARLPQDEKDRPGVSLEERHVGPPRERTRFEHPAGGGLRVGNRAQVGPGPEPLQEHAQRKR